METEKAAETPRLEEALARYHENLDKVVLPKLKEDCQLIHAAFKTIHSIFLKKGIIHEDPYKGETKSSEITIPPSTSFSDSDKADQMSMRLSSYEVQLDFLLNYYQFSMDFLEMPRIRLLAGLLHYIAWDQIGPTAQDPMTKALGEFIGRVKQAGDLLSMGLLHDSLDQIKRSVAQCFRPLKDITDFSKEFYKLNIRSRILPRLALTPGSVPAKEEILKQVKKHFHSALPGKPFYPELVYEVIDEEYGPESAKLKEALIQRFSVAEAKTKNAQQQISFPAFLLDAIRTMGTAGRPLEEAAGKLAENSELLQSKKNGFMEKLKKWLASLSNKQGKSNVEYEVEYIDQATAVTKHEKIHFESFITDVQKRARGFTNITVKGSPVYAKMEKADEPTLFSFLERQMDELAVVYRRLQCLDTFFKDKMSRERELQAGLKGIKIELTGINNSMTRARQKKHEYIARKEEYEQMKKLGIG
ncbi:MAG: hypothetical protein LBC67_00315 [Spirochaetales bacterium]|jgi:hypothetical protein|nr:hypothetical protein [Spirochaetales bacterium]